MPFSVITLPEHFRTNKKRVWQIIWVKLNAEIEGFEKNI
jgi:hypothetical protein